MSAPRVIFPADGQDSRKTERRKGGERSDGTFATPPPPSAIHENYLHGSKDCHKV